MTDSTIKIVRLTPSGSGYRIALSNRDEPFFVESMLVAKHRLKDGIVLTAPQAANLAREAAEAAMAAIKSKIGEQKSLFILFKDQVAK